MNDGTSFHESSRWPKRQPIQNADYWFLVIICIGKKFSKFYLFDVLKFQIDTNRENILCRNVHVEKMGIGMYLA
ncbi:hypothetical protein ABH14_17300 [Brevibacillus brevis]|nr:hypothetical protein [Brevibacillus brevis]